ncbi:hypothetical protein QJS04_geneDACA010067 [Acorus gramineus]|uniref:DUF668 domain-containing protein n=1 Tax=Acorus gramineus TaxID=55184 RepID=A0AAV9BIA7_ACOGR|nr:hypothetical protein QJS04_geneDACA010067 [Acorus gramineus]
MGADSWLSFVGLRRSRHRRPPETEAEAVGILTFEVSSLLSRVAFLWRSLSDGNLDKLRQAIASLEGVGKLVSDDDRFLLSLSLSEAADALSSSARHVSFLSHRCSDLALRGFGQAFDEMIERGFDPFGWCFGSKKMERKVKKIERLVSAAGGLYQEMEVLTELEMCLRRARAVAVTAGPASPGLFELVQKVSWHRQEVKSLKHFTVWGRSFDYVVRLLARSLFTVIARARFVFGSDSTPDRLPRSRTITGLLHSSKSGPIFADSKAKWSGVSGCIAGGIEMPIQTGRLHNSGILSRHREAVVKETPFFVDVDFVSLFGSKRKSMLYLPPPNTLGATALALHYANVIIMIEKLAGSPHLIAPDVKDDLYVMLPTSVRSSLRDRLKDYSGKSAVYDDVELAEEWGEAVARILEWLAPLAHNMVRWQSEHGFEQRRLVPRTGVLLFQTLYFANQAKTEAAITELLVGLNYLWRYGNEIDAKAAAFDCDYLKG